MTNNTALALAATLLLGVTPALAEEYGCTGIFSADTTLETIEKAFGRDNVTSGEVPGAEGEMFVATTVFKGDPEREMQVRWWDEETLTGFAGVTLSAADSGPLGVKVGMPIAEVEAINGEPFDLWGFYWDYGGGAGFESGKLSALEGGCFVNLRFAPTVDDLPEAVSTKISGDVTLRSDMPELQTAKVAVWQVNLGYPYPDEGEFAD